MSSWLKHNLKDSRFNATCTCEQQKFFALCSTYHSRDDQVFFSTLMVFLLLRRHIHVWMQLLLILCDTAIPTSFSHDVNPSSLESCQKVTKKLSKRPVVIMKTAVLSGVGPRLDQIPFLILKSLLSVPRQNSGQGTCNARSSISGLNLIFMGYQKLRSQNSNLSA